MTVKVNIACLALALLLLAAGCVETSMMYHGNHVSTVPVVALQEGGPYEGRWETFDLIIDYQYTQEGDVFEISGQFALGEHYPMNYSALTSLSVYLFFLDESSRVLETVSLIGVPPSSLDAKTRFSRRQNIPAATAGISFGYDGAAAERESRTIFYQLPLSP